MIFSGHCDIFISNNVIFVIKESKEILMKHYEIGGLLCTITEDDEVVGDNDAPFQRNNAAALLLLVLTVHTISTTPHVAD